MSWNFPELSGCSLESGSGIESLSATSQTCCLPLGTFEIECNDDDGNGWATYYQGSIAYVGGVVVQGVEYCKEFHTGYSMTDSVTISDPNPPESIFVFLY